MSLNLQCIAGSVMGWSTPALTHPVTQQWVSKPNIWAKSPPSHFVGQYHIWPHEQSPNLLYVLVPIQKFKLLKFKNHSSWWQIQVVHAKSTICVELYMYILAENRKSLKKCSPLDVIESVWSLHCRWFGTKLHHCDTQIQVAIYSNISSYHHQHEPSLWFCFDQSVLDSTVVSIYWLNWQLLIQPIHLLMLRRRCCLEDAWVRDSSK